MIYFIRAGAEGDVKIGTAANVSARLKEFQVGQARILTVIRTIEGGRETERWLHKHYAARHVRGEWFRFSDTMLTIVPPPELPADLIANDGDIGDAKAAIQAALLRSLPRYRVPTASIARASGVSYGTIAALRRGHISTTAALLLVLCRKYPDFAACFVQAIDPQMQADLHPEAARALNDFVTAIQRSGK